MVQKFIQQIQDTVDIIQLHLVALSGSFYCQKVGVLLLKVRAYTFFSVCMQQPR